MTLVDAKRTKRARDDGEGLSLEEHIARRRACLVREREEAPALRRRAREMRAQAEALTRRWEHRARADLRVRADELDAEARARESMAREHAFEQTVVGYLRVYHERAGAAAPAVEAAPRASESIEAYVRHTDLTAQRRTGILDEFLAETSRAPPKVAMAARDVCPRCADRAALLLCAARSIMSCPRCGYQVAFLDATSSSTSFDEVIDYSAYSYKRVNHYMMHLTLVQGKEAHRVPDEVLEATMADLYDRQGVRRPEEITQRRVRETLRRLRLRKAYDHVAQVAHRLSGIRPPRLAPAVEEQLRNLFLQMQPAFQRHAPKTRTNFLSYGFVLYRSFQILGLHHMLDSITLLKGRDKLEANDAIFRKMCEENGWPIFELPPEAG
jgi:hypothetical protein